MLRVNEAVIVESRYDKQKLSSVLDAVIIETNGFGIYKDKSKLRLIRRLAMERGLIILTDSDRSGRQIRSYIAAGIPRERIKHIYIPDIYGKERRKAKPSAEGKLGVEGMSAALLEELFRKANVCTCAAENKDGVTNYDLFELGLSGTVGAKEKKKALLRALDLPDCLSTASFLSYINSSMTREEFMKIAKSL